MKNKTEPYAMNPMDEVIIEIAQIRSELDTVANAITDLAQKGITYTLPDAEIQKVSRHIAGMASKAVAQTRCAPPDMSNAELRMSLAMGELARDKVAEVLSTIEVNHTHTVNHVLTKEVKELADKKLVRSRRWLMAAVIALSLAIGINSAIFFSGELYWGHRLWAISGSEYQPHKGIRDTHANSYEYVHERFSISPDEKSATKKRIRKWGREVAEVRRNQ